MLHAVMFTFESLKVFQYYTDFKRRYIFIPGAKLSIAKCLQVMENEKYSKQLSLIPLQQQDLKMPFPSLCNYLYIFFIFLVWKYQILFLWKDLSTKDEYYYCSFCNY